MQGKDLLSKLRVGGMYQFELISGEKLIGFVKSIYKSVMLHRIKLILVPTQSLSNESEKIIYLDHLVDVKELHVHGGV